MKKATCAIDFGTSNSLMSLVTNDGSEVLSLDPNSIDPTLMKTVFYSPSSEKWFLGAEAYHQYIEHDGEGRLIRSIKKFLPDPGFNGTKIAGRMYKVEELVAIFLREMKNRAETQSQYSIESVVLGRPALFSMDKKEDMLAQTRLEAAAKLAGFKDVSFCPEPVAAAHGFQGQLESEKLVLIGDFGGGTSDFTILKMGPQEFSESDVLAVHGIFLAGNAYDGKIMEHFISKHFGSDVRYKLPMGKNELFFPRTLLKKLCDPAHIQFLADKDIRHFLEEVQRWSTNEDYHHKMDHLFILIDELLGHEIFSLIERTKISLSSEEASTFLFKHSDFIIEEILNKSNFVEKSESLTEQIERTLLETFKLAGISPNQIGLVCLTGGTAKLPAIKDMLSKNLGASKIQDYRHFHSVIEGLAIKSKQIYL
ncbi:MAG: Hsp70 family protein [Bacteriovoracaceae bacterium]|jgi:hypothetical chaperone protein|nr:Hsp70 family protein [Bacteriovoracaceae bacterium]